MKYLIKGGNRLNGEVNISGAKNSVLPILAATILTDGCKIGNVPNLSDVKYTKQILEHIQNSNTIPHELSNKMRSSILFMGSMLGKRGEIQIYYPGGCQIGKRPIDIHIWALRKMGAEIKINENTILAKAKKLKGCTIQLPFVSVGATENILLAAVLADGVTCIENAAIEPEICDLINFLNHCGADITSKYRNIYIKGVKQLHPIEYDVMFDRIEAITYICMGAITAGEIFLNNVNTKYLKVPIKLLRAMGIIIEETQNGLYIDSPERPTSIDHFKTSVYPGVPTDIQPQLGALLSIAKGKSLVREDIFSSRLSHTAELNKMGADIQILSNREYLINGVPKLSSAHTCCYDLRGGAALLIAALNADGKTLIENSDHITRGYEDVIKKLTGIGGNIEEID